jgi:ribonucleoside-diphosphate reductase alpha chain
MAYPEETQCGDTEVVGGVVCPVDPQDALQCESCQ